MHFLPEFRNYLLNQKDPSAKVTVKNYLADVRKFISWFEKTLKITFSPELVTLETVEYFEKSASQNLSASSLDRHVSSLRKFFNFLKLESIVASSPFEASAKQKIEADPWHIKEFKNYLYVYNASRLTIKNYLIDVKNFLKWVEKVAIPANEWNLREKNLFKRINNDLLGEYKLRLSKPETGVAFSPATVNRKLSSLRKYLNWARENGYVNLDNELGMGRAEETKRVARVRLPDRRGTTAQGEKTGLLENYSKFPPLRVIQKSFLGIGFLFDFIFISPFVSSIKTFEYLKWRIQGKPIFKSSVSQSQSRVKNLPKEFYAPYAVSTKYFSPYKKLVFALRQKRPKWYKRYHSYPLAHHFHYAILIVFMSTIGFGFYYNFIQKPTQYQGVLAATPPTGNPRVLSFQGKLTDNLENPIKTPTTLRFGIYDSVAASGSALRWQEVDTVTPDSDGIFSVILGLNSTFNLDLFATHAGLWLGVTVGQTAELTPRKQLATVAFAENSETLQGLPPITAAAAGTNNVVLALDSSGNLTIGGTATPTFQATGGKFTLSGNTLLITTNAGTNNNVQIAPSGSGFIDLQKPLQNSTLNNNISTAKRAVEVDDLFAILATSSGQTAFTVNQNGAGPIISASSSGIAKFTVDNAGNTTIAGNLTTTGTITTNGLTQGSVIFTGSGGVLSQNNAQFFWDNTSNRLGIGITNPAAPLHVAGTSIFGVGEAGTPTATTIRGAAATGTNIAGADLSFDASNGTGTGGSGNIIFRTAPTGSSGTTADTLTEALRITNAGNVGIRTSSFGSATGPVLAILNNGVTGPSAVAGQGILWSNAGAGTWRGPTTSTQFAAADYAEEMPISGKMEQAEVVSISPRIRSDPAIHNRFYVERSKRAYDPGLIGIVSSFVPDTLINSKMVALIGRVPAKVTNENGVISKGDHLTSSATKPGYAMKALKAGQVIGTALQDFDGSSCDYSTPSNSNFGIVNNTCTGKILVFVNAGYYDPNPAILTTIESVKDFVVEKVIDQTKLVSDSAYVVVKDSLGNVITRSEIFASAIIGNIKAGFIDVKEIATDTLTAKTKITSPIVETDVIKPSSSNKVVIKLETKQQVTSLAKPKLEIQNASGSAVASIDSTGNASFSGTLKIKDLTAQNATISGGLTANNASVSGTIRARNIIADNIDVEVSSIKHLVSGLRNQTASPSAKPINIASFSAQLANIENFNATIATFVQGFASLGPASLTNTSIFGQLSIGATLILKDNSINVLGQDLNLQPLKQGGVSFLSGKVYIDTNGNMTVGGTTTFKETLFANVISPIPGNDLVFKLLNKNASEGAKFLVQNASGSAVASIDSKGDATFRKLNLNLISPAFALSEKEIRATGSAGIATISAKFKELTINNNLVTEKSLIYITPVGAPSLKVPFLLRQIPSESFTVGVEDFIDKPMSFNWLIIN